MLEFNMLDMHNAYCARFNARIICGGLSRTGNSTESDILLERAIIIIIIRLVLSTLFSKLPIIREGLTNYDQPIILIKLLPIIMSFYCSIIYQTLSQLNRY